MIPKLLHRIVNGRPGPKAEDNWKKFQDVHPGWEFHTWHQGISTSSSPIVAATRSISRADCTEPGALGWQALLEHGGIVVNDRCRPIKSLDPLLANPCFVGTQDGQMLSDDIIGAVPRHPAIESCVKTVLARRGTLPSPSSGMRQASADFLTLELAQRDDVLIVPPDCFHIDGPLIYQLYAHRSGPSRFMYLDSPPLKRLSNIPSLVSETWRISNARLRPIAVSIALTAQAAMPGTRGTYIGNGRMLVRLPNGTAIITMADDLSLTPELLARGIYDAGFWQFLRRAIRPGDHVVDVGANIGLFTLVMAAKAGRFGRVYAYEADPELRDILNDNVSCNWLKDRVRVLPFAAWSSNGEIPYYRSPHFRLCSAAGEPGRDLNLYQTPVAIPCETLETRLPQGVPIRLVKVDVEGGERHVLQGLWSLLERKQVGLLDVEVDRANAGAGWAEFVEMLRSILKLGATTYVVDSRGHARPVELENVIRRGLPTQHLLFSFIGDPV
jgi:FkbM family methyltransferase